MKTAAASVLFLGATLLWGCAQIVGITTLDAGPEDGGTGSGSGGSGSGGSSGGGSSSGGSGSGSSSGGTSSSSGGSSGSSSGGSSSGCTVPAGDACGVDPQCGCAKTEKCDVAGTGAAACVTAGAGALGSRCTANTECAAGLSCVAGVCHAYCNDVGSTCPGGVCIQGAGSEAQDQICSIGCTLAPNSCGSAEACVPLALTNSIVADCEAPGTVGLGGSCTANAQCVAGDGCDGTTGDSFCLQWCELSPGTTACSAGTTCTSFSTPLSINGVTYGDCQP